MQIPQITFTRFIAALGVVFFHFGKNIPPFDFFIVKNAYLGVSYFYVLSGFIMIIAYYQSSHINFNTYQKNRFSRIYPIYFVGVISQVLLTSNYSIKQILLCLFAIQSWVPGYALALNTPGWSISVEIFFYLLFPLLFNKYYKSTGIKKIALVIFFIFIITQIATAIRHLLPFHGIYFNSSDFSYFPLVHLNQFLIGNLSGLLFIRYLKDNLNYKKTYWILLSIVGIALCLCLLIINYSRFSVHNGIMAILFAPIIIFISFDKGYLSKFLSLKPLVYLGEISYSLYILQLPVYVLTSRYITIDNWMNLIIYIGILTIISIIAFESIEKPARNYFRKKL